MADNLKRGGAYLPGIRPGENTAKYIDDNIATPCKLFGDKESDVNENLWSLKISNLEP